MVHEREMHCARRDPYIGACLSQGGFHIVLFGKFNLYAFNKPRFGFLIFAQSPLT